MTTAQLILCYFCLSGIAMYLTLQPETLQRSFENWCERHKDDKDFEQVKHRNECQMEILSSEQSVVNLISLTFGWLLFPYMCYTKVKGLVRRLTIWLR